MKAIILVVASAILGAFFTPAFSQISYQPISVLSHCLLPPSIAYSEFLTADSGLKADRCITIPYLSDGY